MKNYHTHTYRCHHACGQDEDYVKKAIEAGFSVLGFSDHTPWHYHSQFKPYMRMDDDQLEEYVNSILYLKNKYKDKEVKIVLNKPFTHNRVVSVKRLFSETTKDLAFGDKNKRECVLMNRI